MRVLGVLEQELVMVMNYYVGFMKGIEVFCKSNKWYILIVLDYECGYGFS